MSQFTFTPKIKCTLKYFWTIPHINEIDWINNANNKGSSVGGNLPHRIDSFRPWMFPCEGLLDLLISGCDTLNCSTFSINKNNRIQTEFSWTHTIGGSHSCATFSLGTLTNLKEKLRELRLRKFS